MNRYLPEFFNPWLLSVFEDVRLQGTNLANAVLNNANFYTVDLHSANLSKANLVGATLDDVYITESNLSDANLSCADLRAVRNWSADQISRAKLCRTKLPEGCSLDPDRDCAELGIF